MGNFAEQDIGDVLRFCVILKKIFFLKLTFFKTPKILMQIVAKRSAALTLWICRRSEVTFLYVFWQAFLFHLS